MNDIEHIPVKPNINNSAIRSKKNTNVLDNIKDSKDPEVQQILNKKSDVFNIEAMKTKEEQAHEIVTQDTSSSWLIVILAIIIVILIVVIVYYVLKYNAVSSAVAIPVNIVKPVKHDGYLHNYTQKVNPQPEIKMERIEHVEKPKNFVEPTKKDLDDIINRLHPDNNKSDNSESDNNSDNNSENENTPVITEIHDDNLDKSDKSDVESSNEPISIDRKIEELIMSDDNLDNDIIDDDIEDQFKKNIMSNE